MGWGMDAGVGHGACEAGGESLMAGEVKILFSALGLASRPERWLPCPVAANAARNFASL